MKLFGLRVPFTKAAQNLSPVSTSNGGWWPILREAATGDWQRNIEVSANTALSYSTVFACVSLISGDIAKMRLKLLELDDDEIWQEADSAAFSPVLRKPNRYQNRIQFLSCWVLSKLIFGNAYILKERDNRDVVVALYVLAPQRVTVLVAPDGSVYYQLATDFLAGLDGDTNITVPASEIIHDVGDTLYHPLVGVSPITACGLAALQGLRIQNNSATFFANASRPGGILTAPGAISDATAARLKIYWEANFSGENAGHLAVVGDGLKYEQMAVNAVDAQLIEQLKWSAETIASCFHIPMFMLGIGPMPAYNNIEALSQFYYGQCLQKLIECIELCLDEGLSLPKNLTVELDLDGLLRMDTATRYDAANKAIAGGWLSPNEARRRENLSPVEGGESPMIQQQNYSLAALAKRDAMANPFAPAPSATPAPQPALPSPDAIAETEAAKALLAEQRKSYDAARVELELEQRKATEMQAEADRKTKQLAEDQAKQEAKAVELEQHATQQAADLAAKREKAEQESRAFVDAVIAGFEDAAA